MTTHLITLPQLNKKWKIMTQILSIPPTPPKKVPAPDHISPPADLLHVTYSFIRWLFYQKSYVLILHYPQNSGFAMNVVPHKIILCVMLAMQLPSPPPPPICLWLNINMNLIHLLQNITQLPFVAHGQFSNILPLQAFQECKENFNGSIVRWFL